MTDTAGKTLIDLTANIVSAYLSNNPTPASEIPSLISQVHAALLRVSTGRTETPLEPAKPAVSVKKSMTPGISDLSRGRQALQVAEAPSAHAIQHDAGAISRQMGPAGGLSDGGAELCGGAFAARQEDGPRASSAGSGNRSIASDQEAVASASRASERMRSTIARRPLERCGVRCSRNPNSSNTSIASVARMCCGVWPE